VEWLADNGNKNHHINENETNYANDRQASIKRLNVREDKQDYHE